MERVVMSLSNELYHQACSTRHSLMSFMILCLHLVLLLSYVDLMSCDFFLARLNGLRLKHIQVIVLILANKEVLRIKCLLSSIFVF